MPRPRNIERKVKVSWWIPESLRGRIDLALYSPLEGGVPLGAHSDLVTRALSEYLDKMEAALVQS